MMNPRDRLLKLQRQQRAEFEQSIAKEIQEYPGRDYAEIGRRYKLTAARIAQLAVKHGVRRPRGPKIA
jgi:hypothetical protein